MEESIVSIHPSLKSRRKKVRSVLKRHERLAKAIREEKWREGMSVFGLPKYNPLRFKLIKKDEEKTATTLGKVDLLEQHKLTKERIKQEKKQKKTKKETTGRK